MRQVTAECQTRDCLAVGVQKHVPLDTVAIDVVVLPLLVCTRCGSQMAITAPFEAER